MALIIETGAGVRGANAFFNTAFMDAYLAERGRSEENGWNGLGSTEKEEYCVQGMDYFSKVWTGRVKGTRQFNFTGVYATATGTFAGLPSDTETITIGGRVYTMVDSLSGVADEVLIAGTAAAMATNLNNAIKADSAFAGSTFGTGTVANSDATATVDGAVLTYTATGSGTSGNYTVLAETASNYTQSAAFTGGLDSGDQALLFPRVNLRSSAGVLVSGVPLDAKYCVAEYIIRAASGETLDPDPTADALGGTIVRQREKVGPIDTDTQYAPGSVGSGRPPSYPAADRYMSKFAKPRGTVIRG